MNLCFLLWISVFPLELWLCLQGIPLGWLPLSSICYKRSREPMLLGMWQEPRSYRRGVSELIAENQSYELGSRWDYRNRMQWWRRVDSISQRKNKPQPVLNGSFFFYVVWMNFSQNFAKMIVTRSLRSKKSIEKSIYRLDSMKPKLCWPCLKSKRQHQDRTLYLTGFGEIMLYF